MSSPSARDPWLDLLRAAAILLVLVHHVAQEWPVVRPWLHPYTSMGAKGVDLFFVLSGWLIGGLFWFERQRSGSVNLGRFWARRWLRTIPPYLGGLALAWTAVWLYRQETFDFGYLLFIQNYYPVMPFFFVSWSLCVEEHFYLILPLVYYYIKRHVGLMMLVIILLPTAFRLVEYPIESAGFGYAATASHLRADGLLLGFAAVYLSVYHGARFKRLRSVVLAIAVCALGLLALDLGPLWEFVFDPLLVAMMFLGLLVAFVGHNGTQFLRNRWIGWVAGISYSLYLTHALVIHAFVLGIYPMLGIGEVLALVVQLALILVAGWVFHLVFERSALVARERLVPATVRNPSGRF